MASTRNRDKILLAIPAYNEERYINQVLDSVRTYISDILVVNDGSTDQTAQILAGRRGIYSLTFEQNRGYGQAMSDIFHFAHCYNYSWVITMDCDFQHEPEYIPLFIEAIMADNADIVSGSRYMADSEVRDMPPSDRRYINGQIVSLLQEQLGLELTDAFCGFKAYRTEAVSRLKLTEKGYAFPLEFWSQAVRAKLKIKELPISLVYNDPNRCFGGQLNDPGQRLKHYKAVLQKSMARAENAPAEIIRLYDQNSGKKSVNQTAAEWAGSLPARYCAGQ
ncbi:MAG: glycosyltransferase family 2 protein [Sedimentisphaerales bacterium]|nr:glycosyltransferase family 2 protein [Sedimentisphaerales bacterium]MBN2843786.1 glycosyltransferase family 2 protein [Sedimentisphaerales bacterium]